MLNRENRYKYIRNIRESKRLRELTRELRKKTIELEKSEAKVRALLETKSHFLNQLAHDLRTPLTPILTLLPLIRESQRDDIAKKDIDVVLNNAKYLHLLLVDVLNLIKIENGKVETDFSKIDIKKTIEKVVNNLSSVFNEKGIGYRLSLRKKIPFVYANEIKIIEVLNNLISNAFKFVPKKGVVFFGVKVEGNYVIVSVKDNGIGILKNNLGSVFNEFYRVDTSRHIQSTGLGLTISKKIIEEIHNGKMWVESKGKNKGTTFYFTLPVYKKCLKQKR